MSMPAALGWVIVRAARDLPGLRLTLAIALGHGLLHHSVRNVAPHRVRRLAHSLKRDIGPAATNRRDDSPMSMTSPRTTLTRGQYAPLLIGLPRRRLPPCHNEAPQCFFGAICGSGPITSLIPRLDNTKNACPIAWVLAAAGSGDHVIERAFFVERRAAGSKTLQQVGIAVELLQIRQSNPEPEQHGEGDERQMLVDDLPAA